MPWSLVIELELGAAPLTPPNPAGRRHGDGVGADGGTGDRQRAGGGGPAQDVGTTGAGRDELPDRTGLHGVEHEIAGEVLAHRLQCGAQRLERAGGTGVELGGTRRAGHRAEVVALRLCRHRDGPGAGDDVGTADVGIDLRTNRVGGERNGHGCRRADRDAHGQRCGRGSRRDRGERVGTHGDRGGGNHIGGRAGDVGGHLVAHGVGRLRAGPGSGTAACRRRRDDPAATTATICWRAVALIVRLPVASTDAVEEGAGEFCAPMLLAVAAPTAAPYRRGRWRRHRRRPR